MRTTKYTKQFKRDYKREKKSSHHKSLDHDLEAAVNLLRADKPLPTRMRDHALANNWNDHRDCHIKPDLLLIYRKPSMKDLELVRLGSHSKLSL